MNSEKTAEKVAAKVLSEMKVAKVQSIKLVSCDRDCSLVEDEAKDMVEDERRTN